MKDNKARRWIDHHLEAASAVAEESKEQKALGIIERARRELAAVWEAEPVQSE